jgi:hypothetical protein
VIRHAGHILPWTHPEQLAECMLGAMTRLAVSSVPPQCTKGVSDQASAHQQPRTT